MYVHTGTFKITSKIQENLLENPLEAKTSQLSSLCYNLGIVIRLYFVATIRAAASLSSLALQLPPSLSSSNSNM